MPFTIPVTFALCLSLLLTGLQVHCHNVTGHHQEQEYSGVKNQPEPQRQPPAERPLPTKTSNFQKLVETNGEFAFRMYKLIASDPAHQNVLFSPLSISLTFAMLTLGAEAETHRQLFKGLGFNLSETEESEFHATFNLLVRTLNNQSNNVTQLNVGNALFIEESLPLQPKLRNDIKTLYEAEGFPINFKNLAAAEKEINDYVKDKTNGKITEAVQRLDAHTLTVLLSYVFFKASWENPFHPLLTKEADFFVDANTTVKVNMMYRKGYYDFLYDEDLSCWVVKVPYNGDCRAWFILPEEGKLKGVEDALSTKLFMKWFMSLKHDEIELHIPKFSISGSYDVTDLLPKQSVSDVFHDHADLPGFTGHHNLKVSKAVQKTLLDVNEGGTEPAAVTVLEGVPRSDRVPPPPIIKFNTPFIILIGSSSTYHYILMAKVMNPTMK